MKRQVRWSFGFWGIRRRPSRLPGDLSWSGRGASNAQRAPHSVSASARTRGSSAALGGWSDIAGGFRCPTPAAARLTLPDWRSRSVEDFRSRHRPSLYLGEGASQVSCRDGVTRMRGRRRRRSAVAAAVIVLGAAVAGCEPGGDAAIDHSGQAEHQSSGRGTRSDVASPPVDALAQARQQVTDAQAGYRRAYLRALAAPGSRRSVDGLLALYTADTAARVEIRDRMRDLADRGLAGRPGPAGYYLVERVDVTVLPPRGRAAATVCTYDDAVVFDAVHKGPGGKEIVVNDAVVSGRTRFHWVQENGKWRLEGGDVLRRWEGANRCPAKSGS
jgi:hypothetical protein